MSKVSKKEAGLMTLQDWRVLKSIYESAEDGEGMFGEKALVAYTDKVWQAVKKYGYSRNKVVESIHKVQTMRCKISVGPDNDNCTVTDGNLLSMGYVTCEDDQGLEFTEIYSMMLPLDYVNKQIEFAEVMR